MRLNINLPVDKIFQYKLILTPGTGATIMAEIKRIEIPDSRGNINKILWLFKNLKLDFAIFQPFAARAKKFIHWI